MTPYAPCRATLIALAMIMALACGQTPPPAEVSKAPSTPEPARWLHSLHASDLTKVIALRGLKCEGPKTEREGLHWTCQAETPLISYRAEIWGHTPGRLEYIKALVTQSGPPDEQRTKSFLQTFANLRYDGSDPVKANAWLSETLPAGGQTTIGPAKLKLSGDASRRQFEIKAPGSDW
jgi:hypothetical protein